MGRGKPRITNQKGSSAINRIAGEKYLLKNQNREEVTVQGSGLQFEVVESGDGGFVEYGSTLTVNQKITLVDGTVVDDTFKSGTPEVFKLKDAIKGYHEGLLLMSVGDRYRFAIPSELAWNKRGTKVIPPSSVILIDCTLISVD